MMSRRDSLPRRHRWSHWGADEWSHAQGLAEDGCTAEQIAEACNRSVGGVQQRFHNKGLPIPPSVKDWRSKSIREARINRLLDERDQRIDACARRARSATFFGDPPPGFSALDGKVGMT